MLPVGGSGIFVGTKVVGVGLVGASVSFGAPIGMEVTVIPVGVGASVIEGSEVGLTVTLSVGVDGGVDGVRVAEGVAV